MTRPKTRTLLRVVAALLGIAAVVASVGLDLRLRRQNAALGVSALIDAHYDELRASRSWLYDIVTDVRTTMSLEPTTRDELEALLRETNGVHDPRALSTIANRHPLLQRRLSTLMFRGGGSGWVLLAHGRIVAMDWANVPEAKLPEGTTRDEPWLALPGSAVAKLLGSRKDQPDRRAAWLVVPVPKRDGGGSLAHVAFGFDPMRFANVFTRGVGETYALGADGRLASTPRFLDELVGAGIVDPSSVDEIEVRELGDRVDPQTKRRERGPLTVAAQSLAAGRSGLRVGYRSFRGVDVAGVWSWDEKFGYGVVTEKATDDLADWRLARTGDMMAAVGVLSGFALVVAAFLGRRDAPAPSAKDARPEEDAAG